MSRSQISEWSKNVCQIGRIHGDLEHLLKRCPELSEDGPDWIESVERKIKQLDIDWEFLKMFYFIVRKATNCGGLPEAFPPSLEPKIRTVSNRIYCGLEDIISTHRQSRGSTSEWFAPRINVPSELVKRIDEYQRKTDSLKLEIVKALDNETKSFSFDFYGKVGGYEWAKFLHDILLNLQIIVANGGDHSSHEKEVGLRLCDLCKELELIGQFIDYVKEYFNHDFPPSDPSDPVIDAFLDHVRSVVVCVAIQSCNYWFDCSKTYSSNYSWFSFSYWFDSKTEVETIGMKRKSKLKGVVDLHHGIDPINPNFLDLNLNFLKAVHKFSPSPSIHQFNLDDDFFRSILTWKGDYDFKKKMMLLVTIIVTNNLDNSCEDVQTFFAEIIAVLMEVASLSGPLGQGNEADPPSLYRLGANICLLKAEYSLKDQLNNINFSMLHGKELKLKSFSNDLQLSQEKTDYGEQSLAIIEDVYREATSLRYSYFTKKCSRPMLKNSLLQLVCKIVIFKAEFFLMELLKSDASVMAYEKVQVESLLEQLKVFNLILTNKLKEENEDVEIIFTQFEAFARRINFFSYSFLPNKITEEMIEKMTFSFLELLDKAQHIKAKLKEISPQFPLSTFPKTYELGFINFLLRNLGELLKRSPETIVPLKSHIEEIQVHLKSFLAKVSDSDMENPGLKDLCDRIIDVVYKMDYVVDSIEVDTHWQHFFWFYDLLGELRLADKQASSVHTTTSTATIHNSVTTSLAAVQNVNSVTISGAIVQSADNVTQDSYYTVSGDKVPAINEEVLARKDKEKFIINQLTGGIPQRDVVSIVGMPGIGKTTLAMKVYNSRQIKSHFHCLAWCTVSQVYEKRKLLLEIINGIQGLNGETRQMSTEALELKLHQCLLRNKYLIVMDDMWSLGAWHDLKNSFPDNRNGSRILLTSRQHNLASEIKPDSNPCCLSPFSEEESWNLLEKKVFKGGCCPEQLLLIGREIAQRCQGLPLAVVAIAGLLEKTEKSQSWWARISESFSSRIINDSETRCMETLEPSYKYLPKHLQACLLYLGFLEDNHIPVTKILQFWLAEGFIKTESKCLEDVAEEYLMDLISRNLVMISKRRSNGKVKECRLHDLLRDFCRLKANEEKFFQSVTRSDEPYASFPGSDNGIEFDFDYQSDPVTFESYRLSISLKRKHFISSRPSGLGTRSLIFFASADLEPSRPYDISFICDKFKFLRVLDLESINIGMFFPAELGLLVQLRYLALSGYLQSIPHSIGNLWKLETLVVRGLHGKVILPYTIWCLSSLRHLHVNNHVAFSLQAEKVGCSFQLDNLVSFSFPAVSYGEDTDKILSRFPNLRKMKCRFLESWDSSKNCNQFPALNLLTCLESLKIVYYGRALNSGEISLPSCLKQLTLSNFRLPGDHISMIGKLPNLEVLKLVSGAFEGQIWDMKEEEFQELKFLKLDNLDIAQWNATSVHLPKLRQLVLQHCKALQKVPDDFEYITSLEIIEVHWCGQSAEESAIKIGEATDEEIKVLISRS